MFVTASAQTRAQRRLDELNAKGMGLEFADVLADVQARDKRDQDRETAPLKPAVDAVLLDTSNLSADQAIARAIEIVTSARG